MSIATATVASSSVASSASPAMPQQHQSSSNRRTRRRHRRAAMDWVDVLYNVCYGGFGYSDALKARRVEMGDTKGLSNEEAESLLRARFPAIGSDTQWKLHTAHPRVGCHWDGHDRAHPLNLHLVREMGRPANYSHARLAVARVHFPAAMPIGAVAQGIHITEYDGKEGVRFNADAAFLQYFKTVYLECATTSPLTMPELAKVYRQCEQVQVESELFVSPA